MKLRLRIPVLLACILSISCGVDEYYYLPQVPEINIRIQSLWEAEIRIPPIPAEFYYGAGYTIFYRIYTSDLLVSTITTYNDMRNISDPLASDYSSLYNVTDPTNTTTVPTLSTFTDRSYFEIGFEGADVKSKLSKDGGTLRISFPAAAVGVPVANINGEQFYLIRSSKLITPVPSDHLYFSNTPELRDRANANSNANADVAVSTSSSRFTYVSMYIAAIGTNQTNFNQIFSKPTHISVFLLPDKN